MRKPYKYLLGTLAVLLCLLGTLFYLLGANGRAERSIWNAGTRALAARHVDKAKIPTHELFGSDIGAACIFANGYFEDQEMHRSGDVEALINDLQKQSPPSHSGSWIVYLQTRAGLKDVEIPFNRLLQIDMPAPYAGTCFDANQAIEVSIGKTDGQDSMTIAPP